MSFLSDLQLDQATSSGTFADSFIHQDGSVMSSVSPCDGQHLGSVIATTTAGYETCVAAAQAALPRWMDLPAPRRGGVLKEIGEALREKKEALAKLVCVEMGKIWTEALGEVQEFIDIIDLAVGMSRQIPGHIFPSERAEHVIFEVWKPVGIVGVITAFNFPVAVLGWNAAIALICGNACLWKGSPTTPLISVATTKIITDVLARHGFSGIFTCVNGGPELGELITRDRRVGLVSFTGSTKVGRMVAERVHGRLGQTILELGGNNATIILPDADLELAIRASVFGAIGTAGQRCTSLRRLLVHDEIFDVVKARLVQIYQDIIAKGKIGDPLNPKTLVGPLHTQRQVTYDYVEGITRAKSEGGRVLVGGKVLQGNFVEPAIVEIDKSAEIIKEELFCPILFLVRISSYAEALEINNGVAQGLSSSLFTNSMKNVFHWLGPRGSDCGIVNVNTSTSGAEIGGAFGGNKDTGGGRESGSDAWKQYMRRSSCAVNYSSSLPLAQGIQFDPM